MTLAVAMPLVASRSVTAVDWREAFSSSTRSPLMASTTYGASSNSSSVILMRPVSFLRVADFCSYSKVSLFLVTPSAVTPAEPVFCL